MAVAHVATGAKSSGGTTTVSIASPAGTAAGQILLAGRAAWVSVSAFTDETDWTASGSLAGGTGSSADNHATAIRVDRRELSGSLAGPTVFDQTFGGGGSGCVGIMVSYENDGGPWEVATATGDDATHGTNRSVASSTNVDLEPGDVVVVFVATDTDTDLASFANQAITASGITFGSTTRRTSGAGVNTGSDGNIEVFEATVSSGSGTVAITLAFDTATSQCGPATFIRLREGSSGVTGTLDATEEDDAGSFAGTVDNDYPGDLPDAAVIGIWDARLLGGSASDPVAAWPDSGPLLQDDLAQATSGNRPVISDSGFDGVRSVQFDGSDDRLDVTLGSAYNDDFALIIVCELLTYPTGTAAVFYSTGAIPDKNILGVDDVEDPPGWVTMSANDGTQAQHHHGTNNQTYLEDVPSRFIMTQLVRNTGEHKLWENDVLVIDLADSSGEGSDLNNLVGLKVGAREDNSRFVNGRVGYVMLVDMTETDEATLLDARDELGAAFNVPGFGAVSGTLDATEEDDTGAFSGVLSYSGTLAATEEDDTGAFAGVLVYTGTLAATEEDDTGDFAGTVGSGISGTLDATEEDDTGAFVGVLGYTGTLVSTEEDDSGAFAGQLGYSGSLASTEEDDVGVFEGTFFTGIVGSLAATEEDDTGVFSGSFTPNYTGTFAVTEEDDVGVFVGLVAIPITGTMVAVEEDDTGVFVGSVPQREHSSMSFRAQFQFGRR